MAITTYAAGARSLARRRRRLIKPRACRASVRESDTSDLRVTGAYTPSHTSRRGSSFETRSLITTGIIGSASERELLSSFAMRASAIQVIPRSYAFSARPCTRKEVALQPGVASLQLRRGRPA